STEWWLGLVMSPSTLLTDMGSPSYWSLETDMRDTAIATPTRERHQSQISTGAEDPPRARDVVASGALRQAETDDDVLDLGGIYAGALDRMAQHVRRHR